MSLNEIFLHLQKNQHKKMNELGQKRVGDIVAGDFRTAGIFSAAGIDFCCGGGQTLEEACLDKRVDIGKMETDLFRMMQTPIPRGYNYNEWEPGFLCDYIVNTHHTFVRKNLPELLFYTRKIAGVHGEHHPELITVQQLFEKVYHELTTHLQKEEEGLFPAVKLLVRNEVTDKEALIAVLKGLNAEHESAGGAMDEINRLTKGYLVPADACNTYMVTLKNLKEFEDDLHIHVHLENNILFPKILQIQ